MQIEIKNRYSDEFIIVGEYEIIKYAVEKNKADIQGYLYLKGSRHDIQYYKNIITIGCEKYNVDYWIENYKEIGDKNNYSPEQIGEYYNYIMLIKQFKELEGVCK